MIVMASYKTITCSLTFRRKVEHYVTMFLFYYPFVDLCWLIGEYNSQHHIFGKCYSNTYFICPFLLQMPITVYIPKTKSFIIIIITLFESQIIVAKHECCSNWGDCKSNKSNQIKANQMFVFEERGKPEFPEKNLSEQSREPTNSAHI